MAKIYGLFGSMTGKLADTVMSVRNGEQIARKYQPVVFNPSTPAQVAQRAKMKLLSQLSAVMAPVIAIAKRGNVSSRNIFTKVNFPNVGYADDTASVTLTSIDLTAGVLGLPTLSATRSGNAIACALTAPTSNLDAVVYAAFVKLADNKLRLDAMLKVTDAGGANMDYPGSLTVSSAAPYVVYAYGIRLNSDAARTKYGNLIADPATTVATLIAQRTLLESDYTLTETKAAEVAAPQA